MKQRHKTLSILYTIGHPIAVFVVGVVLCLMMARGCTAQTVKIENSASTPYSGWVRATIDRAGAPAVGRVGTVDYAVGRAVGLNLWVVDLKVALAPGAAATVNLANATARELPPAPAGTLARWLGGPVYVNGVEMQRIESRPDGAGWLGHWRARHGRTFCTDLWLTYYPDQPAWCSGEVMVTSSNPTVTDTHEITPVSGIRVQVGDAVTIVPNVKRLPSGALVQEPGVHVPVIAGGVRFADGQGRAVPIVLVWPRHLRTTSDWLSAKAAADLGLAAVGIEKLLPQGNPRYPPGFTPAAFVAQRNEAIRRAHTWEPNVCGPNATAGDSGLQEDTCFVRGEALLPGGTPAVLVTYLTGLGMWKRPVQHLEPSGLLHGPGAFEAGKLPIFYASRPHTGQSIWPVVDKRGKLIGLDAAACNGWFGDHEHNFHFTTVAAARLTGTPATQHVLSSLAHNYPKGWTVTPGWSNTWFFASRAAAWECSVAVGLWDNLEDRVEANAVRAHWQARWQAVYVPQLGSQPNDIVDVRVDDPRLGPGAWWMPWQAACLAYWLDVAGERFNTPNARALALRLGKRVLDNAWRQQGNRWVSSPYAPVAGVADANEDFNYYGMSLAVACVLRHEPQHVKARAVWQQLTSEATQTRQTVWLAPGVQ